MTSKRIWIVLLAALFALGLFGCENASRAGNNLTCHGGSCSTGCDEAGTTSACNVVCEPGTTCDARCNAGQPCNFDCQRDARCTFDCTSGSCQVTGPGDCSCSGECIGTCNGSVNGGDAGPGGSSCEELCGDPSGAGYAACIAACG